MIACPEKREKTYVFDFKNIVFVFLETWVFHVNDLPKLVQDNKIGIILGLSLPVNLTPNLTP